MKSIIAGLLLFTTPAFATDWDNEPSELTPPTCVAYFTVSLPSPDDHPSSPNDKYVKEILRSKGYISHYDAPCDPGPGYCVGASGYLQIRGFNTRANDGTYGVRLAAYHMQARPNFEIGVYHQEIAMNSFNDTQTLIDMVKRLPTCAQIKLKEMRWNCDDQPCMDDLTPAPLRVK